MVAVAALAAAVGVWLATSRTTTPITLAATPTMTAANPATSKLASTLIPLPAGATAKQVPGIGPDGSLTLDQFLAILYPTSWSTESTLLLQLGFQGAAVRSMVTANGQQISIYLAEFGSLGDAHYYNLTLAAPLETDPVYASYTHFYVPTFEDTWGFELPTLDSHGNTQTIIYGEIGSVAIKVDCSTPGKIRPRRPPDTRQPAGHPTVRLQRPLTQAESGADHPICPTRSPMGRTLPEQRKRPPRTPAGAASRVRADPSATTGSRKHPVRAVRRVRRESPTPHPTPIA